VKPLLNTAGRLLEPRRWLIRRCITPRLALTLTKSSHPGRTRQSRSADLGQTIAGQARNQRGDPDAIRLGPRRHRRNAHLPMNTHVENAYPRRSLASTQMPVPQLLTPHQPSMRHQQLSTGAVYGCDRSSPSARSSPSPRSAVMTARRSARLPARCGGGKRMIRGRCSVRGMCRPGGAG
jgi:hypothetical protein